MHESCCRIHQELGFYRPFAVGVARTDQFIEGLETVGIMDALKTYSSIMQVHFIQVEQLNASK